MKNKANFLSAVMSLVLVVGMSPLAAWADEEGAFGSGDGESTVEAVVEASDEAQDSSSSADEGVSDGASSDSRSESADSGDPDQEKDPIDPSEILTNNATTEFDASVPFVDGEILVVCSEPGDSVDSQGISSDQMLEEATVDLDGNGNVDAAETVAALELVDLQAVESVSDSAAGEGMAVVARIDDDKAVEQAIEEAAMVPGVAFVQPNYLYQSLEEATEADGDSSSTDESSSRDASEDQQPIEAANDSQIDQQFYLEKAGFISAWNAIQTNNQVTVAVLDTGCRLDHEDLQENLLSSLAYDTYHDVSLSEAGIENNGDASGHGTAVAGIIAARANNEIGIAGSSFNANILPIKVFSDEASSPTATTADVIEALDYVSNISRSGSASNLRVVNMSFGFYGSAGSDQMLQSKIASLRSDDGIVCVCAGGNGSGGSSVYPADYPEAFSVASLNQEGGYSSWSDLTGKDIATFGEGIHTTLASSQGAYGVQDGSSASAALVSGAAALLVASDPSISIDQIEGALRDGAVAVEGQDGPGSLNVSESLGRLGVFVPSDDEGEEELKEESKEESEEEVKEEVKEADSDDVGSSDEEPAQSFTEASHRKQGPENSWRYTNGIPNPSFNALSLTAADAKGKGIDVSQWQGTIDWASVKAAGVKFAIIRCGYGDDYSYQDDTQFARNVSECERLGIPYGVYIYSYATNTTMATSEANHAIRLLKGHKPTYPVYIDIEDGSTRSANLNQIAETFCKKVSSAGYTPGVYASLSWWNDYLTSSNLDKYEKWVAQWNVQCDYKKSCSLWQYTSSGSVKGISGSVDMDYEFKSFTSSSSSGSSSSSTTKTTTTKPARTLSNGMYVIKSKVNTNKVIDIKGESTDSGANVILNGKNGNASQTFRFTYDTDGYYAIQNLKSKKVLELAKSSKSNGVNIRQATYTGAATQKWKVSKNSDGSYTLISKATGRVVDVTGAKTANGTNIQQYASNKTNAQKFVISSAKQPRTIADGTYTIVTSLTSTRSLGVKSGSTESGANVQLAKTSTTSAQKFKFTYDSVTGFYTITNVKSGMPLDLTGSAVKNGANIRQYKAKSTLGQRWIVEKSGNYYVISSAYSPNYVIDVKGAKTASGTNVQLYKWNGTKAQKFVIKKA